MNEPLSPTPAELRFGGSWKMIIPFALLPILIVSVFVGIFLLFGKLAENRSGISNHLAALRSGSSHERWQAAYELSGSLARENLGDKRPEIEKELLSILREAKPEESTLRQYLLVALGQVGGKASLPAIMDLARNDSNGDIQIWALWALGRIGLPEGKGLAIEKLKSNDAGLRKTAAFALGAMGSKEDVPLLLPLLDDSTSDVRWNTALSLAKLGDSSGKNEILLLLDSKQLEKATPQLRSAERNQIVISAINGAGQIRLMESLPLIEDLASNSTDPMVRETARRVVLRIRGTS